MLLHPWGFSRQDYWTGLPCLPPGDLPHPRIELSSLMSPALAGGFFTASATWEAPPWTKFMTRLLAGTWVLCALDLFDSLYGEKWGHAAMTDMHKFLPSRLSWTFFDFSLSTVEISKFVPRQVCMYVCMNVYMWVWVLYYFDNFFLVSQPSFLMLARSFLSPYEFFPCTSFIFNKLPA